MTKTALANWIRDALVAACYTAVFYVLSQTANIFWYLPAGLRFATLLASPMRRWPWIMAADALVLTIVYRAFVAEHGALAIVVLWMDTGLAALSPCLLRMLRPEFRVKSPTSMAVLIGAMLLAALCATIANLFFPFYESDQLGPLRLTLQLILGDFIGMLVLVPVIWILLRDRPERWVWHRWRLDVPCVLAPMLLLYAVAARGNEAQVYSFSALLCIAPSIYFASRTGWRGAALALAFASTAVACSGVIAGHPALTVEAQGFLAVAGSVTLLLGVAYDSLRANNVALLGATNRLERLTDDLRQAAQRNLETGEQIRKWITSELHDEIGQNLAALHSRVRLLERHAVHGGATLIAEIGDILGQMRRAVSGLLSSLRPVGLDEFGLEHALREGTIRSLMLSNGIIYESLIEDPNQLLARLDDHMSTTLYRIVQEAATNTTRYAQAKRFRVRLRLRNDGARSRVLLTIDDDGSGFEANHHTTGIGLQGMRDRVFLQGGRLRLRSGLYGTRIQVRLSVTRMEQRAN